MVSYGSATVFLMLAAFNATLESLLFWPWFQMGLGSMLMQQRKL
jgi:hypothetical protein